MHKHDHHSRRGLLLLVGQRRRLLNYLRQDRHRPLPGDHRAARPAPVARPGERPRCAGVAPRLATTTEYQSPDAHRASAATAEPTTPVLGSGARDATPARAASIEDRHPRRGAPLVRRTCARLRREGSPARRRPSMTEHNTRGVHETDAVIDNGSLRHPRHPLRDRPAGPAGRRLRRRLPGDDTMVLSATTAGKHPEGAVRLLPADGRRRGADVRRGPHPRLVLPPRGPARARTRSSPAG